MPADRRSGGNVELAVWALLGCGGSGCAAEYVTTVAGGCFGRVFQMADWTGHFV